MNVFTMKNIIKLFTIVFIFSCDSPDAIDCLQSEGDLIMKEVVVNTFDRILVNRDIELIIKEDADFRVIIQTGVNLLNDIEISVRDNQLVLTDNNSCNYFRNYGITKVYVYAPNLKEVSNSSQYEVSSDGFLSYPELKIISENFQFTENFTVGDFRLRVLSENLDVVSNNISSFYISGEVNNLNIAFYAGSGRFEGENLISQNITIFHRGSNDMIVNPQISLSGELRGAGNVISLNEPPIVDVREFYIGRLIFQ